MTEHPGQRSIDLAGPRDPRRKQRVPFRRPVRLEHEGLLSVIEAVTADISESGMFVQTAKIPVGTSVNFSIALGDGFSLIEGRAEVVWFSIDETGVSTGIGVRFLELKGESLSLLRQIVAAHGLPHLARRLISSCGE